VLPVRAQFDARLQFIALGFTFGVVHHHCMRHFTLHVSLRVSCMDA
jgi:hypothetical protein